MEKKFELLSPKMPNYKTKVVMYGRCAVIPVGTKLNLSNSRDVFCIENCELFFDRLFVESHAEFFERVEEKSLAEQVLEKHTGKDFFIKDFSIIIVKAMQEYHKLAGGWTDEDMMDFANYVYGCGNDTSSIMDDFNAFKQKRGIK